jgi:hypothetical protein
VFWAASSEKEVVIARFLRICARKFYQPQNDIVLVVSLLVSVCTDNACSGVHILSVYRELQVYEQLFSSVVFVILELGTISRASEHSVL